MRACFVVLAAAACGRVGFDARGDAHGGIDVDARGDAAVLPCPGVQLSAPALNSAGAQPRAIALGDLDGRRASRPRGRVREQQFRSRSRSRCGRDVPIAGSATTITFALAGDAEAPYWLERRRAR